MHVPPTSARERESRERTRKPKWYDRSRVSPMRRRGLAFAPCRAVLWVGKLSVIKCLFMIIARMDIVAEIGRMMEKHKIDEPLVCRSLVLVPADEVSTIQNLLYIFTPCIFNENEISRTSKEICSFTHYLFLRALFLRQKRARTTEREGGGPQ